jgi:hypothetical protein
MPRSRCHALLASGFAVLSLTACAGEPWVLARTASTITLRWYDDTSSEAQARGLAGAYCAQTGKSVELGDIQQTGSAVRANYRCV